jgi:agarase
MPLAAGLLLIAWSNRALSTEKFVRVAEQGGRWSFQAPDGNRFFSLGINSVEPKGFAIRNTTIVPYHSAVLRRHEKVENWRKATAGRLLSWGVNTLGAWSDPDVALAANSDQPLYYTVALPFAAAMNTTEDDRMTWLLGGFPDVFSKEFATHCRAMAERQCLPRQNDRRLLGYFLDNELRWRADQRLNEELLITFLRARPRSAGRRAAVAFLQERYKTLDALNEVWARQFTSWDELLDKSLEGNPLLEAKASLSKPNVPPREVEAGLIWKDCVEFKRKVAEQYFRVTTRAVREVDPNHLVLGVRFSIFPGAEILDSMAEYCDVLSISIYDPLPRGVLSRYVDWKRPILISEFAFRGADSGLPNSKGAGMIVKTQKERAEAFTKFAEQARQHPNVVGLHWFRWVDEPADGRFDGEDSNYGIVNINDEPYQPVADAMKAFAGKMNQAVFQEMK